MERVGWGGKVVMGWEGWNGRDGMEGIGWEGYNGRDGMDVKGGIGRQGWHDKGRDGIGREG